MHAKAIASILVASLCMGSFFMPTQPQRVQAEDMPTFEPQSTTWLDGWEYRKEITISNNIEDYQTKITVSQSDDATDDVDCEGHCNNNFSDIRFACANGTLVPYWIEEKTDGDDCTIWIKNEYNDSTLHIYYGNIDALDNSSGSNTWKWYEKWTTVEKNKQNKKRHKK